MRATVGVFCGRNARAQYHMIMPPEFVDDHDCYVNEYIRTGVKKVIGTARETRAQHRDGTIFPVELSVGRVIHVRGAAVRRHPARSPAALGSGDAAQSAAGGSRTHGARLGDGRNGGGAGARAQSAADRGHADRAFRLTSCQDLFKAFASSKGEGLGLGLAISRTIAQTHGGDLTVDPGGDGRGACFTLHLPLQFNGHH